MKTASFVLKVVGAALTFSGIACLVVGFGQKIFGSPSDYNYDEF